MALLDLTSILLDPDMVDSFTVIRRAQSVDVHGRGSLTTQTIPDVLGVVTASSPSDLERRDDFEVMTRSIAIVCQFKLRGETTGYQPDLVIWRGDQYLVKHVDPYPQFGGFFQVECSSIDKTDASFDVTQSAFIFNQPQNAVNLVM